MNSAISSKSSNRWILTPSIGATANLPEPWMMARGHLRFAFSSHAVKAGCSVCGCEECTATMSYPCYHVVFSWAQVLILGVGGFTPRKRENANRPSGLLLLRGVAPYAPLSSCFFPLTSAPLTSYIYIRTDKLPMLSGLLAATL